MIECVIFDMDGVLVDSEPLHKKLEREILSDLGVKITEAEHQSFTGMDSYSVWELIRNRFELNQTTEELIEMETQKKRYIFATYPFKAIDGIYDLVDKFQEMQLKLGLASSSTRENIERVVKQIKLNNKLTYRISGDEIENGKPAPDIYLNVANHFGVKPENCLVIEDSRNGTIGAKAAGMTCVGFQNPNSGGQDLSLADLIVPDFSVKNRESIYSMLNT